MTPNEKAATYLEWKPFTWCDECGISRAKHSEMTSKGIGHYILAPDMTKPENYMRALEELRRGRSYGVAIIGDWSLGWGVELYLGHCIENPDGSKSARTIESMDCQAVGDAAIQVLAALYDEEHPND